MADTIPGRPAAAPCDDAVCRHCLGRHSATGGMLSEAEKELIHHHRKRLRFNAGETICDEGRAPSCCIGNIISGVMKLDFTAVSGEVGALLFPGDFLGPFSDTDKAPYTATALSDCELCCFEGAGLHSVFASHPRLQENFLQHFADAVERAREDAAKLRRPQAVARVAALLRLFAEHAADDECGTDEVQLPLRRAEIARLLGLTTETVSRCLSRMRRDGIIRPLSRNCLMIKSPPRLRELAEN